MSWPMPSQMMRTKKLVSTLMTMCCCVVLCVASYAYACVPQSIIMVGGPGAGKPGDKLSVRGIRFTGSVELRWNAFDGPLLGTITGPDFTTDVTLPDALPGVYVIVALTRIAEGSVATIATSPVVVTGVTLASGVRAPATRTAQSSGAGPSGLTILLLGSGAIALTGLAFVAGRFRRGGRAVERRAAPMPIPQ